MARHQFAQLDGKKTDDYFPKCIASQLWCLLPATPDSGDEEEGLPKIPDQAGLSGRPCLKTTTKTKTKLNSKSFIVYLYKIDIMLIPLKYKT